MTTETTADAYGIGDRVRVVSPGSQHGKRGTVSTVYGPGDGRPYGVTLDDGPAGWTFDADDLAAEDYDPATNGGHFVADPTGGGTWHAGPEPVEHGPECTGCAHDCPWRRTPAPLGAPYCQTCDDHAEAADVYGTEPDAMRCDLFGHEPGPAGTCGACGAPVDLAGERERAAAAVDLAAASHRAACERVGRLIAELDAARADVARFREEHAAAVDRHAALY